MGCVLESSSLDSSVCRRMMASRARCPRSCHRRTHNRRLHLVSFSRIASQWAIADPVKYLPIFPYDNTIIYVLMSSRHLCT